MSTTGFRIVRVAPGTPEAPAWLEMRRRLWPHLTPEENAAEAEALFAHGESSPVWVCVDPLGHPAGFVEADLRDVAAGCETSPVGYIEGWFVAPEYREKGAGRLLVETAENWARARGLREMASDADLNNIGSQRAHARLGYIEVERVVCFRKGLGGGEAPPGPSRGR